MIAVVVVAASVHENAVVTHGKNVGIEVEVVERNPAQTGFVPIPKRWNAGATTSTSPAPASRGCTGW
ncbi:hypothetical protein SNL152K_1058 [Streptomyces sp. NL15-2K]|nr:hypothetical protein SNL152K_1058 [Streptomyces sp. NL15-2K]